MSGIKTYDENNKLHSFNDLPANTFFGTQEWYHHGKLHRNNNMPAVITERGHLEWWINGHRHRDNGPAIIRTNEITSWYKKGYHVGTW